MVPQGGKKLPKAKVTVSLDVKAIEWLDSEVEKGNFESRSAGVQQCVEQRMKQEGREA